MTDQEVEHVIRVVQETTRQSRIAHSHAIISPIT
jgi:hypothetical protein